MSSSQGWVERRTRGNRTTYRARYQDPYGDWHTKSFDRKRDADTFLADQKRHLRQGTWIDEQKGETTLAAWSKRWLASKRSIKPKTRAGYESLLRSRILPTFGEVAIGHIRPLDIEEWVDAMVDEGLSASRIQQAHQCLNAMMKAAVRSEMIFRNPADGIELPSYHAPERSFLNAEQVARLADAFDEDYRIIVYVLAYGGLRWGELVAIRRKRCDLLRRRIVIAEAVSTVSGELIFGDTKTHRVRTIQLPPFVADMLAKHLEDVDTDPDALVFTAPKGGTLRYSNFRRKFWNPARERAGFPDLTPHELRHSCASLLRAMGADVKAIQAQLGHSSTQVTYDTYTHLFEGELDDIMAGLDAQHRKLGGDSRSESHTHSTPNADVRDIREAR